MIFSSILATQCFLPMYHRGVSNAQPIAEIWRVNAVDCLAYCIVSAPKNGVSDLFLIKELNYK